jgi:hypothetical protein
MIRVIRIELSILLIFNGLVWFLAHFSQFVGLDIIYSLLMVLAGLVFLLRKTGIEIISVSVFDNSVFIKWLGKIC